mgnify:FL=1
MHPSNNWHLIGSTNLTFVLIQQAVDHNFSSHWDEASLIHFLFKFPCHSWGIARPSVFCSLSTQIDSLLQKNSLRAWSFKRAVTIRTYRDYHPIPVPLNLLSQLFLALCRRKSNKYNDLLDNDNETRVGCHCSWIENFLVSKETVVLLRWDWNMKIWF